MSRQNRGTALALVLWGLVVGGALLTFVTMLAVQEQRAARALGQQEQGLVGTERVGAELLTRLSAPGVRARLPRAFDSLPLDAGSRWNALVRRLAPDVYLLQVAPREPAGPAAREAASVWLGWLLRPVRDSLVPVAAVSVARSVALADDVVISGLDDVPAGIDSCAPPDSAIGGIAAESISTTGSASLAGAPPELLQRGGDLGAFAHLSPRATVILPSGSYTPGPATVSTSCDLQPPTNWGDPGGSATTCGSYFPIVRIDGDATVNGGTGQGILLVNGDLHVTSPFTFHGIVIVTGAVDITAPTDIHGILSAAELRTVTGPVSQLKVHYSKCLLYKSLEMSSIMSPLPSRAWIQLFQAP